MNIMTNSLANGYNESMANHIYGYTDKIFGEWAVRSHANDDNFIEWINAICS
jgi:hypothetical protein